ncbi:MAG: zinc-regulated TonB-dependent outer membrane receptor [Nitrospirota bacterium]
MRSAWIVFVLVLIAPAAWAQDQSRTVLSIRTINLDISLDVLAAAAYFSEPDHLNFGGHDPQNRGFTLQNAELTLGGTVDPYIRGDAHIIFLIEDGETAVELEEAFFTTLALPFHLQLMGGQFFTRFGRLNPQHPHMWDFADQPVINNRLFGPDGLRNPGVQLSWLAPLPFYLELIGGVQNATGETATSLLFEEGEVVGGYALIARDVHHLNDLLYMGRAKTAWNPSDTIEVAAGLSGLYGPNASGSATHTEIYGTDLYAKWRPLDADRGFPFVALQAEAMWRAYQTPGQNLRDSGAYAQVLWGFVRRWVAGARVDIAKGNDPADPLRDRRWRVSPNLTFYPGEFSKWRLQYNHDRAEHLADPVHAVFLQVEFLLGSHGAHQF